jgi:magnesium transporter
LYIVDSNDHLRGLVTFRSMVSSIVRKPQTPLGDLMETEIVSVNVNDDQEEVANKVARYDLLDIPVVDDERRLIGIITHDDVIDVVREEATEDAHRIAAVDPLDVGYLRTSLLTLSWKRGIWLIVLFVGALLTALALEQYEGHFDKLPWLVMFIPLVISSGGNSGSQTATLIITGMSTGDIRLNDWLRVVGRELAMGVILGTGLGIIGFFAAFVMRKGNLTDALVIPGTLLLVVMCGTLLGSLLPLAFRRIGLDPALMSNPFVAGIIDILGIIIYMGVATAVLPAL